MELYVRVHHFVQRLNKRKTVKYIILFVVDHLFIFLSSSFFLYKREIFFIHEEQIKILGVSGRYMEIAVAKRTIYLLNLGLSIISYKFSYPL